MENRHGLAVNSCVTQASGRAEPEAALAMVEEIAGWHRITLGADKDYDRKDLVKEMREHAVTRTSRASQPVSLTSAPLAMRTTSSVSASVSGWKRSSAGSRP